MELCTIEGDIVVFFDEDGSRTWMDEDRSKLEKRKKEILRNLEDEERIKSREIWMEKGDNNTKFFHCFANQRKNLNTI